MRYSSLLRTVALASLIAAPVMQAGAQSCGTSTYCISTTSGLIFFGRDDYQTGSNKTTGTNSAKAQSDFVAAVLAASPGNRLGVQTFDGSFTGSGSPLPNSQAITFGSAATQNGITGVAGLSGPNSHANIADLGTNGAVTTAAHDPFPDNSPDRYAISGGNYLADPDDWTLQLGGTANAFGFFGIDVAESGLNEALKLTINTPTAQTFTVNTVTAKADGEERCSFLGFSVNYASDCSGLNFDDPYGSGNLFFFGFVAKGTTTFNSVGFDDCGTGAGQTCNSDNLDVFAYDNIYAGGADQPGSISQTNVTPEPATMSLLATGLVGLAGVARRRRRRTA